MASNSVLISAATFLAVAALLGYVLLQRARSTLLPGMITVLCSMLAWIGGMLVGTLAPPQHALASLGVVIHFAGVCAVASSFATLAFRFAHVRRVEEEPVAVAIAMAVPSVLCFAIVLTNPWHGLFGAALDGSFFSSDDESWRGPLYPLVVGWVYVATGGGLAACLRAALVTHDRAEGRKLLLISSAALMPLLGYAVQNAGLISIPADTPVATLCLAASSLVVVLGITQFGFLDSNLLPLRQVIERIEEGLLLISPRGHVVESNPAATRITDLTRERLMGAAFRDVLEVLGDDGTVHDQLHGVVGDESRTQRLERSPDHSLDITYGCVQGRHGRTVGHFAVIGDRSEQLRHQRLRHRTQRLESMGVLLGGIAHEINNPLAYVRANLGHLSELADDIDGADACEAEKLCGLADQVRDVVTDCIEGLERISTVVDRTRSLSPKQTIEELGPTALEPILEETRDLARLYTGSAIPIEIVTDDPLPPVTGCRDRLRQVFLNLLVNACHATTGHGTRIRILTAVADDALEIRVEDDGPGVPDAVRDQIFDPFFTTKDPDQGMGLGLSIVHDIVHEHHGEIHLDASEWGGACFHVRLPRSLDL